MARGEGRQYTVNIWVLLQKVSQVKKVCRSTQNTSYALDKSKPGDERGEVLGCSCE